MNFQTVLAGLPDAVIAVDEALRVVFWNSAAEELTERSARRADGRVLKEVFPADASLVRRLSETLATGESRSEPEGTVERPDHRLVPVSIVTAPLFDRAGRVEAAVAVVRDLSRIRQLEAEVRRGETLAAAGRMAVGLAHEIRNPLGAIRGAVQLLGRELGALLTPGETFYEWGAETGLYFVSRRSPPSGAFYVFPLLNGPAAYPLAARAVADLERRPPAMFVVNKGVMFGGKIRHPILDWAIPRYVTLAGTGDRGTFVLYVRRGSRLDVTLVK